MNGQSTNTSMRRSIRAGGFTLLELLVAVMITAGVAGAATISLSQALRAKKVSESRQEAFARAEVAAERMSLDLQNMLRDGDLFYAYFVLFNGGTTDQPLDEFVFFAKSNRPVRHRSFADQNEGAEYEMQYRVMPIEDSISDVNADRGGEGVGRLVLWRRVDPIPDEVPEGGGVVFPIVEGVTSLSIEAFDGEQWYTSWESDRDGLPHAVRIVVSAKSDDGRTEATFRKVVPIDRVPLPYTSLGAQIGDDEEDGEGAN